MAGLVSKSIWSIRCMVVAILFLCSCAPTRKLPEGSYLLNKNIINNQNKGLVNSIHPILKQKPNRKILGLFRFHLSVYNTFNKGKSSRFKNWVKRTIGEEPVLFNPALTNVSKTQIELFLFNQGYFDVVVTDSVALSKKKTAKVYYDIIEGEQYRINKIGYQITDPDLNFAIQHTEKESFLRSETAFNSDTLQKERDRLTELLRNRGYYQFSKEYIYFKVDSSYNQKTIDLILGVYSPGELPGVDSTKLVSFKHRIFEINRVYIQTSYDPKKLIIEHPDDTIIHNGYYFLKQSGERSLNKDILLQNILLKSQSLFQLKNLGATHRNLSGLGIFRFINIKFEELKDSNGNPLDQLDCHILLTQLPRQSVSLETEGTHDGGYLGMAGNIVYQNKNLFTGAESLSLKLKGALEAQRSLSDTALLKNKLLFFNTLELGPELNLSFQKLLIPFARVSSISKNASPVTTLSVSYNLQDRPDFQRKAMNFSFGYTFRELLTKRHLVMPLDMNFVKVNLTDVFEKKLNSLGDLDLLNIYSSHSTLASRYSYIYNNQDLTTTKNHIFFRANIEGSGNLLRQLNKLINKIPDSSGSYSFFGVTFSQFIKQDLDFRFYQYINPRNQLVYRVAGGTGIPWGNSKDLPYEKSFFGGGSNGIRAWTTRTLGPGSYKDELHIDQTGDIKIEMNLEYRFDMVSVLQGALFVDAGNIWLLEEDKSRPGTGFKLNDFADEIAVGGGVGLRFDFTFFIIRLDGAVKLKDPARSKGTRWVYRSAKPKDINFNIGIGYPF